MKFKESDIRAALKHYRVLEKAQRENPVNEELARHTQMAIAALEFCLKHRWIPVTERLPEPYDTVLMSVKEKDDTDTLVYEGGRASGGKWELCGVSYRVEQEAIKAWMPLPEPYEEEKEE